MKNKNIIGLLLIIALILSFVSPALAEESVSISKIDSYENGLVMPSEQFNELYGKPNVDRSSVLNSKNMKAKIAINSIQLIGDSVSFNANICYKNTTKELSAKGSLFNSYKHNSGINSVVGKISDTNSNFKILLFEIFNDKAKNNVLVDSMNSQKPILKIYLKDNDDNVLLFEINIPNALQNVVISNNNKADTLNDAFWFVGEIQPYELKLIPSKEDQIGLDLIKESSTQSTLSSGQIKGDSNSVYPMGVGNFSDWVHSNTYYASFYIGDEYYQCYSLPYGSWKASDISSSDTTWTSSFKIAEHCSMNGITYRSLENPFKYSNIRMTNVVGNKSTIVRTYIDGRMVDPIRGLKTSGGNIAIKIGEKLWSTALPVAPSLSTILGWISDIEGIGTSKTVTLGSSNIKLNNSLCTAESVSIDNLLNLYQFTDINGSNTGHYITFQTVAQFNSATRTSVSTNGAMKVSWDVYYAGDPYDSQSKTLNFSYTAKP